MLQAAFESILHEASMSFWVHKRFKKRTESVRDNERCGRSKEVNTSELIGQRVTVRVTMLRFLREFSKRFRRKRPAFFKSGEWHFHQDNALIQDSVLVTDYLTKMGIKTLSQSPYSRDVAPCDFWLFPKLTGCRYETTEEMKAAVKKGIDTFIQENFHGAFKKLLEWYNKCIAAGGDYFEVN